MSRVTGLSVLLCTGMMVWATPSFAGFSFTPPPAQEPQQQSALAMDQSSGETPMPIVPNAQVTSEALPPVNSGMMAPMPVMPAAATVKPVPSCGQMAGQSPVQDHILTAPANYQPMQTPQAAPAVPPSNTQPVYIRRERTTNVMKPPKDQPMDTEALLKATQNGNSVALTQEKMDKMQAQQDGQLLINPYPLENQAIHDGDMGTLPVQQAMMEEAGTLRPVVTPGSNTQGTRARAKITSRYDSGDQYMDRAPVAPVAAPASFSAGTLTPIPGGEGIPLNAVESAPLAPMVSRGEVSPAVAAALIPAKTSAMPRPAIPQDYPVRADAAQPAMMDNASQTSAGGFTNAVGFGRDLPLALALSQVVPPEYSYVFAKDVNVGSTVSWQGGKPWNQVMDEMLSSSGMRATIQNNQIMIQNANS